MLGHVPRLGRIRSACRATASIWSWLAPHIRSPEAAMAATEAALSLSRDLRSRITV